VLRFRGSPEFLIRMVFGLGKLVRGARRLVQRLIRLFRA